MKTLIRVPEVHTYQFVHNVAKIYPDFIKIYKYEVPIFTKISGFESEKKEVSGKILRSNITNIDFENALTSKRRTKTTISDIVLCNEFDLFVTFTFDPAKVNRESPEDCKKAMSSWLKRQSERRGKFAYIIVPEFHKKGNAIHFHALFKDYKGKLVDSGKKRKGRRIYNISSYRLGFSTAIKINNKDPENRKKVSSYIRKYITKDMPTFNGKKRYWCSTGLIRPLLVPNSNFLSIPFIQPKEVYKLKHFTIYESNVTIDPQLLIRGIDYVRPS